MSEEYKLSLTLGGMEIVASGPDPDWVTDRFHDAFKMAVEPAKKIPIGFSVTGAHLEVTYE